MRRRDLHIHVPPHGNGKLPLPHMPQASGRTIPDIRGVPCFVYNVDIWARVVEKDAVLGLCGESTLSGVWESGLYEI